jgi:apolipoprotein N-acyltransferase
MDPRWLQWAAAGGWLISALGLWLAIGWSLATRWQPRVGVLLGVLTIMGLGQWSLGAPVAGQPASGLRIAVLQPSLLPDTDDAASRHALEALIRSSQALLARADTRADLLVWPELPMALSVTDRETDRVALHALVRETGVPLLMNGYAHLDPQGTTYSNATWLLMPDGTAQRYDKQVLVPFGEYLPAAFSGLAGVLPGVKRYAPGPASDPLVLRGHRIGTPICFEALMPDRLAALTAGGATLLINQGDDLWFQSPRAQHLHLAVARLRAVEEGVPILRVFNSGISVLIDERGRLSGQYGEVDGLFEAVYDWRRPE